MFNYPKYEIASMAKENGFRNETLYHQQIMCMNDPLFRIAFGYHFAFVLA